MRRTTRSYISALTSSFLLPLAGAPVAKAQTCDSEFIKALRSHYQFSSTGTTKNLLHEASCSSTRKGSSTSAAADATGYGSISFGTSSQTTRSACLEKNVEFFENHKKELAYSFLPKEAFDALPALCVGGLTFTAKVAGNEILLRARYTDLTGTGEPAKLISNLVVSPSSSAKCDAGGFTVGQTIIPGGREVGCRREKNEDVRFTLRTNVGDRSIVIRREPTVQMRHFDWSYNLSPDSAGFQCIQNGKAVGGFVPGGVIGGNGYAAQTRLIGYCAVEYGVSEINVDGKLSVVNPIWRYGSPAGSQVDCYADDALMSTVDCLQFGICSSPGDNPVTVNLRAKYWCAGHSYKKLR